MERLSASCNGRARRLTSLHLRPISPCTRELRLEACQYGELNLSRSNSMQTTPDTLSSGIATNRRHAVRRS